MYRLTDYKITFFVASFFVLFSFSYISLASTGSIDNINRYAWGENVGWIDFGSSDGSVNVTSQSLSGYAWGENIGWISLNCSNTNSCSTVDFKVTNDGNGVLSGYAWGENVGWINFSPTGGGVSINSSGVFSGYAWGENTGWINFSTDNPVTTAWRIESSQESSRTSSSGSYINPLYFPNIAPFVSNTNQNLPPIANQQSVITNQQINQVSNPVYFSRNLQLWDRGEDVKNLQKFLNSRGFTVSKTGPGSPGSETNVFGPLTFRALLNFQKKNGVYQTGYFGSFTRAVVNVLGK